MADAGPELTEVFSGVSYDGFSMARVAGLTAAEAVQRLPVGEVIAADEHAPWHGQDFCGERDIVGVTDVPGGCVIAQPWAYRAVDVMSLVGQIWGTDLGPVRMRSDGSARAGYLSDWLGPRSAVTGLLCPQAPRSPDPTVVTSLSAKVGTVCGRPGRSGQ